MANLKYIRPNKLRVRVKRIRLTGITISAIVGSLGLAFHPVLLLAALGAGAWIWNSQAKRLCGAEGEEQALGLPHRLPGSLAELHAGYTVFNNLHVWGNRGPRELDLVVVGPNGVFVVEAKNYRGEIGGSGNELRWRQTKLSRRGNSYLAEIRSPVTQVRGAALALKDHLRRAGIHVWVEGIVVFTHPDCRLHLGESTVPIVALPALADHILNYAPRHRPCPPSLLVKTLARIQSGDGSVPRPALQVG